MNSLRPGIRRLINSIRCCLKTSIAWKACWIRRISIGRKRNSFFLWLIIWKATLRTISNWKSNAWKDIAAPRTRKTWMLTGNFYRPSLITRRNSKPPASVWKSWENCISSYKTGFGSTSCGLTFNLSQASRCPNRLDWQNLARLWQDCSGILRWRLLLRG